jgi:hypothetical protein
VVVALLPIVQAAATLDVVIGHRFWGMLGSRVEQCEHTLEMLDMWIEFRKHLPLPCALACDLDDLVVRYAIRQDIFAHVLELLLDRINPA